MPISKRLTTGLFFFSFLLILAGCATHRVVIDTTNLENLENLSDQKVSSEFSEINRIRMEAIKETALGLGAQGGLAFRAAQLNHLLEDNTQMLRRIFNFNGLLLDNNVLPPVIEESKQSLSLSNPDVIQLADHTYKILKPARFVTAPPTWKEYLWMNYQKPELPDKTLLPKAKQEVILWKRQVKLGFQQGMKQADTIYRDNLAKLKRDFNGMLLYRKLLSQNIVSKPFVADTNLGVTSNAAHTEMRVNDRVLRITAHPELIQDSQAWKPVLETETP